MKKVLIIQGNPRKESLSATAAQKYKEGALRSSQAVELVHLIDLDFDLILRGGYKKINPLEKDLVSLQQKIKAADHLVLFYPTWWGTMPALVKGFIDRIFLPEFAFKYDGKLPEKLLKGKSARVVTMMDSPFLWYKITGSPGFKAIKNSVLSFCGFSPIKITALYSTRDLSIKKIEKWLEKIYQYGQKDAQ